MNQKNKSNAIKLGKRHRKFYKRGLWNVIIIWKKCNHHHPPEKWKLKPKWDNRTHHNGYN